MTEFDRHGARRLRDRLEPLAGCVYFAPEVHAAFEAIGFGPPNPWSGVAGPNMEAYFTSRGACMGQVSGHVVAAAFGVFNPDVVAPAVDRGFEVADREAVLGARERGTVQFLERVLDTSEDDVRRLTELLLRAADGAQHAGRHLYAGLRSLGMPGTLMGDLWRAADLVREYRGDCHVIAWTSAGLSAPEIMLLTELWWGIPRRSYALSRAWTAEQYDRADARLVAEGWIADDRLTPAGRELRRTIEDRTDDLHRGVIDALGDDLAETIELLDPIATAIVDANGYPHTGFQTASDLDEESA